MPYDSTIETTKHIERVQELLNGAVNELVHRGWVHDASKLRSPEKELFDEYTPLLKEAEYGSDDYKAFLEGLKPALDHHYAHNTHHPQHYLNGIDGMNLFDLIEMFFDWKAATERTKNGDLGKSIEINATRFNMSDQLKNIFTNTLNYYNEKPNFNSSADE